MEPVGIRTAGLEVQAYDVRAPQPYRAVVQSDEGKNQTFLQLPVWLKPQDRPDILRNPHHNAQPSDGLNMTTSLSRKGSLN